VGIYGLMGAVILMGVQCDDTLRSSMSFETCQIWWWVIGNACIYGER